jgi:hypothetical protein
MNTQNKTAHNQGNINNPLKPLQQVARNKASLINPVIGLNAVETLSNIGFLLTAVQELSSVVLRYDNDQQGEAGLSILINTMQSAISYEVQQGVKS